MIWFLYLTFIFTVAGASIVSDCNPETCYGEWNAWAEKEHIKNGVPLRLYCSVASGHFPFGVGVPLQLPLIFEGNYDLCSTFESAHFCTISIPQITIPVLAFGKSPVMIPFGPLVLQQCVSKSCDLEKFQIQFESQLEAVVNKVLATFGVKETDIEEIDEIIQQLVEIIQVDCTEFHGESLDVTGWITLVAVATLGLFTLGSSVISTYNKDTSWRVIKSFSVSNNFERLCSTIPGDFGVLNGIRFFSMCWVIAGHATLRYMNVKNPTAVSRYLRSFSFTWLRSAEFAVDTFFFLSAFLAMWATIKVLGKRQLTLRLYVTFIVARYLRLTPTYILVLFTDWKVMPAVGNGPYWSLDAKFNDDTCSETWYYNLLYVNNLFPWDSSNECIGWTWYLANDFQFFLLVAPIAKLYLLGKKMRLEKPLLGCILQWGPCVSLVLIQLFLTGVQLSSLGGVIYPHGDPVPPSQDPRYQTYVYVTPWCRITPYAVGMILALVHYQRVNPENDDVSNRWRVLSNSGSSSKIFSAFVFALSLLFCSCISFYFQYRCTSSAHECDVWNSQFIWGFFIQDNWSKSLVVFWYSWQYLFWSVGLSIFTYILICSKEGESEYDFFGLKGFFSAHMFTPLARLTYNAYMIHIPILSYFGDSSRYMVDWYGPRVFLVEALSCIVLAYLLSFIIYMICEKPVMNLISPLLKSTRENPPPQYQPLQ